MKKRSFFICAVMLVAALSASIANAATRPSWEKCSYIHVEGNHLVNEEGEQVMLHGIMDTPSPYFCGYRFTNGQFVDLYQDGDKWVSPCIQYFQKLFKATTDKSQGQYCNVFRLHLDPCWTNDASKPSTGSDTGEANISQYSRARLEKYLKSLFLALARNAQNNSMYVIMRPPGVCPQTIQVGGAYQKYLLDVWDAVTSNSNVREYAGWLSLELANEPVKVLDANGKESDRALHDFFQPILEKVRANGFKGIVWIPGATWQQNYKSYAVNPITDTLKDDAGNAVSNIGYAVHFYPGWFSTSDAIHDAKTSIRAFADMVPVVRDYPVMITEVDWSPENPNGQGHYNESGQWVVPNYGTWATGSTSKFGLAYKAVVDYFGNIGMTLTHTHDYLDIDYYLSTQIVRPAFTVAMGGNAYEACSGACFQWYPEYAKQEIKAREWPSSTSSEEMFPLRTYTDDPFGRVLNPSIWEKGSFVPSTGCLTTGQYGFGGWEYNVPLDLSKYNYIVVEMSKAPSSSASFRLFDETSYWSKPYMTTVGGKTKAVIPLKGQKKDGGAAFDPSHVYRVGFWTTGGSSNAVYIKRVFVSNDGVNPVMDYILGDVNNDKKVTVEDANMVVEYCLGNNPAGINLQAADVNGDKKVTIADANAIINLYLKK